MSLTVNDLEQINTVVTGAVNASEGRLYGAISESEQRLTKSLTEHMDARFDEATLATAELVDGVLEHMDERFAAVDERFVRLEGEVRHTNRIVRQHSLDIVELRSKAR